MDLQIQLMIIDRGNVSIMSTLFTNRGVTHLRFVNAFEWIRNTGEKGGHHRNCFHNPPEKFRCIEIVARMLLLNVYSLNEVFINEVFIE